MTRSQPHQHTRHHRSAIAMALMLAGICSGCDESGPRVFTAQHYRADLGCLEAYAPLGLVEAGPVGSLCEPVCLVQDEELYVSTVCAPYPTEASLGEPESADCTLALAAAPCDDATASPDAAPEPEL
jgi:hypothetical protein